MQIPKSNFSEWYNAIIKEAQLCDLRYEVKGFVVFMPWAVLTMNKMYEIYEKELQARGHLPALFPALIPEHYIMRESEHVAGFVPEVFWVATAGKNQLEEKLAMRPTSETAIYPMYALWIHGKKDLPLKIYQRCQVWRYETKATKPFIRSREFYWIETHNCFATKEDAEDQVREDMEMAEKVLHGEFGVPFLFFKRPQWDKFAGADDTYAADTLMPDRRVLQLPSTHMLGQNFAKAFGIKYMDENEKEQYVWQTCYGPAISRIYAAVIATHGDDKGLVLPFELAPLQIVIVPIVKKDTEQTVIKKARELRDKLAERYSVKLDESEETPGAKYNFWEMKGVPLRIEIGMRDIEHKSVTIFRRDIREKKLVKENDIFEEIENMRTEIKVVLRKRADEWFKKQQGEADTIEELNSALERYGLVKVPFCTDRMEGERCADVVKEKCHANIRGMLYGNNESPKGKKCIGCGKKATLYLYAARQY
ncbi:MAG: proline--tRNA ligase [Candidatus Bilamarchaeaceae archaeon]